MIASVSGATKFREYTKYASQQSAGIPLQAGRKYYIEALHNEGTGNDFISVGWKLPDGTLERPIAGNRLIPMGLITENKQPVVNITSPADNSTYASGATIKISASASDSDGTVYSVTFKQNGVTLSEDFSAPYEYSWTNVPSGSYQIVAVVRDDKGTINSDQVNVTVNSGAQCTSSGKIYREIWTGITGTSVSSIPVNIAPDRIVELTSFSTPTYYANDYGSRIRGYLCVPVSGAFTFYIASDDNSELWLSSNEDPANKIKIAYLDGAVPPGAYGNKPSQKSAPVNLLGGHRYYIEALQKEGKTIFQLHGHSRMEHLKAQYREAD